MERPHAREVKREDRGYAMEAKGKRQVDESSDEKAVSAQQSAFSRNAFVNTFVPFAFKSEVLTTEVTEVFTENTKVRN